MSMKRLIQPTDKLDFKSKKRVEPIPVNEKDKNTITKLVNERKRNVVSILRAWLEENPEDIQKYWRKSRKRG